MSEQLDNQAIDSNKKEESISEFSDIKKTEDYSSPEGPSNLALEIRCPLCPKFAKITINNIKNEIISECPDNHYMKLDFLSFVERSTDHPIKNTKCSICNSNGKTNNYCLECNKYFCDECLEKHNKNDLPYNNGGIYSNILLKNNSQENNGNTPENLNTSFPNHLSTLNLVNNNSSIQNTVQHHVININEQDNNCAIHKNEKFLAFCTKCNKSFCKNCLEELKKGLKSNLNAISCGKFGNTQHNIKKLKDIVDEKKLKKIKQNLDKEVEIINYIENKSNIIIELILEKINNLREIHLLKEQLYNLYLSNKENSSLVKTVNNLNSGFNLNPTQFNTNEKLLTNLEIINLKLNKINEKEEVKQENLNNKNIDNNNNNDIINNIEITNNNNKEEDKKVENKPSKSEIKKMKEEKKKQIQKIKEEKKKALKKKKEEMKKLKQQKKNELKEKKENNKDSNKDEENKDIPFEQNDDKNINPEQ